MKARFAKFNSLWTRLWLWVVPVLAFGIGSCESDPVAPPDPKLTDVDWADTQLSILLNNEPISGVSATFSEVPDKDSVVMMTLSGLHPIEDIDIELSTTLNSDGNVEFNGRIWELTYIGLSVKGIYRPGKPDESSFSKPSVNIDIDYWVPCIGQLGFNTYIPFNDKCGFKNIPDPGVYPMAKPSQEIRQDTCGVMANKINTALREYVSAIEFAPDPNGVIAVRYYTPDEKIYEKLFRYWACHQGYKAKYFICIENAKELYEFLFNAFVPQEEGYFERNPFYTPESDKAYFYIYVRSPWASQCLLFMDNDMKYKIFPYLWEHFSSKGEWTEEDKPFIDKMEYRAKLFHKHDYEDLYMYVNSLHPTWCFDNDGWVDDLDGPGK